MANDTPVARGAARQCLLREVLENLIFRKPDLDAVRRGWDVHRPTPYRRVYRDPRWHSIVTCADCRGIGQDGAGTCPGCGGRGTARLTPAETTTTRPERIDRPLAAAHPAKEARVSELANESVSQRLRAASAKRSEGVR